MTDPRTLLTMGVAVIALTSFQSIGSPLSLFQNITSYEDHSVMWSEYTGGAKVVDIDTTITVVLKVQMGTGYSWVLESNPEDCFTSMGKPFISGKSVEPGGSQNQVFTFLANQAGHYTVTFAYRPGNDVVWPSPRPVRTVTYDVTVSAPPAMIIP
jgi:hypothetical protein